MTTTTNRYLIATWGDCWGQACQLFAPARYNPPPPSPVVASVYHDNVSLSDSIVTKDPVTGNPCIWIVSVAFGNTQNDQIVCIGDARGTLDESGMAYGHFDTQAGMMMPYTPGSDDGAAGPDPSFWVAWSWALWIAWLDTFINFAVTGRSYASITWSGGGDNVTATLYVGSCIMWNTTTHDWTSLYFWSAYTHTNDGMDQGGQDLVPSEWLNMVVDNGEIAQMATAIYQREQKGPRAITCGRNLVGLQVPCRSIALTPYDGTYATAIVMLRQAVMMMALQRRWYVSGDMRIEERTGVAIKAGQWVQSAQSTPIGTLTGFGTNDAIAMLQGNQQPQGDTKRLFATRIINRE
jgi:hypothetical protein